MTRSLPLYTLKRRDNPEARLQRAVVQVLKLTAPDDVLWFKITNEGKRSQALGAEMKRQGLQPGAADLCIVDGGKTYFLELKAKGEKPTREQIAFGAWAVNAGAQWSWADSIEIAIKTLNDWGVTCAVRRRG